MTWLDPNVPLYRCEVPVPVYWFLVWRGNESCATLSLWKWYFGKESHYTNLSAMDQADVMSTIRDTGHTKLSGCGLGSTDQAVRL